MKSTNTQKKVGPEVEELLQIVCSESTPASPALMPSPTKEAATEAFGPERQK